MTEFIALYRGRTVSDAELVALSAQPAVVRKFFDELLGRAHKSEGHSELAKHEPLQVVPGGEE
jgi:hypothetical protein